MPKISIVSTVFRPGGIDVLLAGMRDQSYKDFEVILVDRRYERRREQVRKLAYHFGIDLIHVPEHRRNGKWITFCSAFNTGLALARGEIVIFLADWMYAPPGWIERHLLGMNGQRRYVTGGYKFLGMPKLKLKKPFDFDEVDRAWKASFKCVDVSPVFEGGILDETDVFTDGIFDASWIPKLERLATSADIRLAMRPSAGAGLDDGWLHIKNDSVHRKDLTDINGFEERLERGRGPLDIDIQVRLTLSGVEIYWNPDAAVYYMDPHILLPTLPYGGLRERYENRWSWDDGLAFVAARKLAIANGASVNAMNNYNINDLSARLAPWRLSETTCIPQEATDVEYWGSMIWPESS